MPQIFTVGHIKSSPAISQLHSTHTRSTPNAPLTQIFHMAQHACSNTPALPTCALMAATTASMAPALPANTWFLPAFRLQTHTQTPMTAKHSCNCKPSTQVGPLLPSQAAPLQQQRRASERPQHRGDCSESTTATFICTGSRLHRAQCRYQDQ